MNHSISWKTDTFICKLQLYVIRKIVGSSLKHVYLNLSKSIKHYFAFPSSHSTFVNLKYYRYLLKFNWTPAFRYFIIKSRSNIYAPLMLPVIDWLAFLPLTLLFPLKANVVPSKILKNKVLYFTLKASSAAN